MKTKEIRDLIDFISQSGLNEVNIETEELKLSVKRNPDVRAAEVVTTVQAPVAQAAPAAASAPATAAPRSEEKTESSSSRYIEVKSPMIGTFYRASNPESPAFASVGDTIEKGQTVCIIEAMKLFNEIESDVAGKIVKVLVENASPVEYDQPLFLVDPS